MTTNSEVYKRRVALRKQKLSLRAIARLEGVSFQAIQEMLGPTGRIAKQPEHLPERNARIIQALRDGKSPQEIADRMEITRNAVYLLGRKAGVLKPVNVNWFLIPKGKFRCSGPCHQIKRLSQYGFSSKTPHGHNRVCLMCSRQHAKLRYAEKKRREKEERDRE